MIAIADRQLERYPAVIVISRPPTGRTPQAKVLIDNKVLADAVDVTERLQTLAAIDLAYGTTGLYTYNPVPLEDAEAVAAKIRAELEGKSGAGDADTPPVRTPQISETEIPAENDTTEPAACQVATIVVRYKGIPPSPTEAKVTGMLLQADGIERGHSIYQQRIILEEHGYKPAYEKWEVLDRGGENVRRREVYVRPAPADEPTETPLETLARCAAEFQPEPSPEPKAKRALTEAEELRRQRREEYRAKWGFYPDPFWDNAYSPRQLGWSHS